MRLRKQIIRGLHANTGLPRLEIEGEGDTSPHIVSLALPHLTDEGERAAYVIKDTVKEGGSDEVMDFECLVFPKSALGLAVRFATDTLSQLPAIINPRRLSSLNVVGVDTLGVHILFKGVINGSETSRETEQPIVEQRRIEIVADLRHEAPHVVIISHKWTSYPENLPLIAIGNNSNLCRTCDSVWLDVDNKPDFNWCAQMESTRDAFNEMNHFRRNRLVSYIKVGMPCPLYRVKSSIE